MIRESLSHVVPSLLLGWVCLLAGCASSTASPRPLPSLKDMEPYAPPARPQALDDAPTRAALAQRMLVTITRLDLPLEQPLNGLWDIVDEQAIAPLARGVWNRNGLRMGVISLDQWEPLHAQLPEIYATQTTQLLASAHPTPIRSSPRLRQPVRIDLTIPPMTVRETQAQRGRLRLLLNTIYEADAPGLLQFMPHHYVPRSTLLPRDPLEKELDGQLFHDLAIRLQARPDRVIVIGLYWPWVASTDVNAANPYPAEPDPQADTADVVQPPLVPSLEPTALPNHLGRSLFTSTRLRRKLQAILLISIAEPKASDPS